MNAKIKIVLHGIMLKITRGIFTQEQAAAHFKKVTGEDLELFIGQQDENVGEFLAFLMAAYPEPAPQEAKLDPEMEDEDLETDEIPTDAPVVAVSQPKRTRSAGKPKAEK